MTTVHRTLTVAALLILVLTASQASQPTGKDNSNSNHPNKGNASNSQKNGSLPYNQQIKASNESRNSLTKLVLAGITMAATGLSHSKLVRAVRGKLTRAHWFSVGWRRH